MNYFILDKHLKTVAIAQTDSSSRNAFHVLEDTFSEYSNAPSTLELTLDFYNEKALEVKEGAHVVFEYEGAYRLFQIKQVEEQHSTDSYVKVYAEESSFELLDAVVFAEDYTSVTAEYLLRIALADTDWQVGNVAPVTLEKYSFTAYDTALSQVQSIATECECMLSFRIKFSPQKGVTGKYVDLMEKATVNEGKRLEFGRNVDSVRRTVDRTGVCTAVIPVGSNGTLVNNFEWINYYEDKSITKVKDLYYVSVDEATRSEINPNSDHHLFYVLQEETDDKSTLCQRAYNYLKDHKEPLYTYEVGAIIFNNDNYAMGEQVSIIDDELGVSMVAEVCEKSTSFCDPDSNSITLANYVEKASTISQALYSIQNKLQSSVLDNPLVVVSPDKPLVEQVNGNGTIWIDISKTEQGITILNKYDITNGEWLEIQQTPSTDMVEDVVEQKNQLTMKYIDDSLLTKEQAVFKQATEPTNPALNQMWIDTSTSPYTYKVWTGTEWKNIGLTGTDLANVKAEMEQEIEDAKTTINNTVSDLQAKADELEAKADELEAKADELEAKADDLQTKADELETKAGELETATNDLDTRLDKTEQQITLAATKTEVTDMVNNIKIGGRNLLKDSTKPFGGVVSTNTHTATNLMDYITVTPLVANKFYTFSSDLEIIAGNPTHIEVKPFAMVDWVNKREMGIYPNGSKALIVDNHIEITFQIKEDDTYTANNLIVYHGVANETLGNAIKFFNYKLEEGNKATAWTPAPEDMEETVNAIDKRVEQNTASISVNSNNIALKVDNTTYQTDKTNMQASISANSTAIEQNAEQIELRATKTEVETAIDDIEGEVDTLATRVSSAETSITQNANEIALRATKTEVTTAIDNIQIGGRNYFKDSDFYEELTYTDTNVHGRSILYAIPMEDLKKELSGNLVTISCEVEHGDLVINGRYGIEYYSQARNNTTGELEDKYLGAWVNATGNKEVPSGKLKLRGIIDYSGYTVTSIGGAMFYIQGAKGTIKYGRPKLEIGNKATAWTPAKEELEQRVSSAETSITQNANEIALRATKTEVTNNIKTAIDEVQVGGRNLIIFDPSNFASYNAETYTKDLDNLKLNVSCTNHGNFGFRINSSVLEEGKKYVLSFKVRKLETTGYDTWIGGHCPHSISLFTVDGVDHNKNWDGAYNFGDNTDVHEVVLKFTADKLDSSDPNIYPQINRGKTDAIYACSIEFSEIMLEQATTQSEWTPAPEDIQKRISNAETSITQNAEQIQLRATKTEMTTSINDAVNNIDVGGRNYVAHAYGITGYVDYNTVTHNFDNKTITSVNIAGKRYLTIQRYNKNGTMWKPETGTYTVSGYITIDGEIPESNPFFSNVCSTYGTVVKAIEYDPTTGYFQGTQQYTNTSTWIFHTHMHALRNDDNVHTIVVTKLQMEKGNKATDYKDAPEDTQAELDKLATRVSSAETSITQNANEIALRATKTEMAKNIENIEIGGKNLYEGSGNIQPVIIGAYGVTLTSTTGTDMTVPSGQYYKGTIASITTTGNTGMYLNYNANYNKYIPKMVTGKTYTVSVYLKSDKEYTTGAMSCEFFNGNPVTYKYAPVLGTTWQRYIITGVYNGNTTSALAIHFYRNDNAVGDTLYISSPQIEAGNKATQWQPAPEDINNEITALGTRVSSAETSITQNAEQIQLRATKTEMETAIDNIQIGGRNLYKNSDNINITSHDSGISKEKTALNGHYNVWKFTGTSGNFIKIDDSRLITSEIKPNEDFTVSLLAMGTPRSDKTPRVTFYYNEYTAYKEMSPDVKSDTFTWVSYTFNTVGAPSMHIGFSNFTELYIAKIKIEVGNKATAWSPAPEDMATTGDLDSLKTRVTSAETNITQNANQIALSATKTEMKEYVRDYEIARGDNMITNGLGSMGDNTNFTQWTYDGDKRCGATPSFHYTTKLGTCMVDEYIPVDVNRAYKIEMDAISKLGTGKHFAFWQQYDIDKKEIGASYCTCLAGTLTTLAQDLKAGDTVVYLTDTTNFSTTVTGTHNKGLIFWNYTDSTGFLYPPEVYSRNAYLDLWADGNSINKTNHTITLKKAWTGATFTAGTQVSQSHSGGFKYSFNGICNNIISKDTWTHSEITLKGLTTPCNNESLQFNPYAKYIKIGFLANRDVDGEELWVSNLKCYNVDAQKYTDQQIASTKSEFKVTTDSISSNVSKNTTSINGLTTRMGNAESSITQNANEISLRATKTEMEQAIQDIEVGGANLYPISTVLWSDTPVYNGKYEFKITNNQQYGGLRNYLNNLDLKSNTEYRMSFEFKCESGTLHNIGGHHDGGAANGFSTMRFIQIDNTACDINYGISADMPSNIKSILSDGNWHKVVVKLVTGTLTNDILTNWYLQHQPNRNFTDETVTHWRKIQLEEGNKVTDWSPCYKDVQNDMNALQTRISSAESSITQNANQIALRVTKATYENDIGLNKWQARRYDMTIDRVAPTFDLIKGKSPNATYVVNDGVTLKIEDGNACNYCVVHFFTNVYVDADKSVSFNVGHDDGGSIYLNGTSIYSSPTTYAGATQPVTIDFKKGWNTLDVLLHELTGGDYFSFDKAVSSQVVKMSCNGGIGNADSSRIQQAESSLVVQADQIASKVEKTTYDVDMNNLKSTVDSHTTAINQNASEISLRAKTTDMQSAIQGAVDGIQVGGTNLFKQSGRWTELPTWWVSNGGGITLDTSVKYLGYNTIKSTVGGGIVGNNYSYFEVDPNKTYTFSAMVRSNEDYTGKANVPLHYHCSSDGGTSNNAGVTTIKYDQTLKANEWKLIYTTFKPKGKHFRPFIYIGTNGTRVFNIAYMKMEEGTKPTDWTPNPDEVEASIVAVKNRVTTAETNITNNANAIALRATKTEVTNNITTAVNNIKIGGTNLLKQTGDFSGAMWTERSSNLTTIVDETYMGNRIAQQSFAWSGKAYRVKDLYDRNVINETDEFTFSCYCRSTSSSYSPVIRLYTSDTSGAVSTNATTCELGTLTTSWQRFTATIKFTNLANVTDNVQLRLEAITAGSYFQTTSWMLEKGNKATDYSHSPEDVYIDRYSPFSQTEYVTNIHDIYGNTLNVDSIQGNTIHNLAGTGGYFQAGAGGCTTAAYGNGAQVTFTDSATTGTSWFYGSFGGSKLRYNLKPNTKYTAIFYVDASKSIGMNVSIRKGDGTGAISSAPTTTQTFQKGHFVDTFTTLATLPTISDQCLYITFTGHDTIAANGYIRITDVMVLEGDWTTKQLPVVPYFSGVKSVGDEGDLVIKSTKKNLLDLTQEPEFLRENTTYYYDKASDTLTMTASSSGTYCYLKYQIRTKANTRYIVSWDKETTGTATNSQIAIYDIYTARSRGGNSANGHCTFAFTSWEDGVTEVLFYASTATAENSTVKFKNVMVEETTGNATEFETYVDNVTRIKEVPLRRIPNTDVYDEITSDGKLIRRVGQITLNGSEPKWYKNSSTTTDYVYYLSYPNIEIGAHRKAYCDSFKLGDSSAGTPNTFNADNSYKVWFFNVQNSTMTSSNTLETLKSWLASNPVTVLYELEIPEVVDFGMPMIPAYKGGNIVSHNHIFPIIDAKIPRNEGSWLATVEKANDGAVTNLQTEMIELESRITNAEIKIDSDSITSTVLESQAFQVATQDFATSSDIEGMATKDDVTGAVNGINFAEKIDERISEQISDDASSLSIAYATKSQLEQTKSDITMSFQNVGGLNLLKNSLGYNGVNDGNWIPHNNNLVRNSGMKSGAITQPYWSLHSAVTLNGEAAYQKDGVNTWKYYRTATDVTTLADSWHSANMDRIPCQAGDVFSGHAQVYIKTDASNTDVTYSNPTLEFQFFDSSGTRISTATQGADFSKKDQWQQVTKSAVTAPANSASMNLRVWVRRNGLCYVAKLMLVRGGIVPSWTPHPDDYTTTFPTYANYHERFLCGFDPDAEQLGFDSSIMCKGVNSYASSTYLVQEVNVLPNTDYTFSFYYKKISTGDYCRCVIYDWASGAILKDFSMPSDISNGYEFVNMPFKSTGGKIRILFVLWNNMEVFLTGIMLNRGNTPFGHTFAKGEVYNTNINFDASGIKVHQLDANGNSIGFTIMSPQEFAGYYDTDGDGSYEKIFYLNGDAVVSKRSVATTEIIMGKLKFINLDDTTYQGWALVPSTVNDWAITEGEGN